MFPYYLTFPRYARLTPPTAVDIDPRLPLIGRTDSTRLPLLSHLQIGAATSSGARMCWPALPLPSHLRAKCTAPLEPHLAPVRLLVGVTPSCQSRYISIAYVILLRSLLQSVRPRHPAPVGSPLRLLQGGVVAPQVDATVPSPYTPILERRPPVAPLLPHRQQPGVPIKGQSSGLSRVVGPPLLPHLAAGWARRCSVASLSQDVGCG